MMELKNVIDISPLISPKTAVFPGDMAFQRDVAMDFTQGDHLGLSSIKTTVHIGAHVDAPNHYLPGGVGIEKRDLHFYLGPCQVIPVNLAAYERITVSDLSDVEITAPRVLFKTNSFPDPDQWNDDFNALSPELVSYLHQKGVILIGIDTPSIDLAPDKDLMSHKEIAKFDMAILEGIILEHVTAGNYTLIALPLKMANADASPVRAVLIPEA